MWGHPVSRTWSSIVRTSCSRHCGTVNERATACTGSGNGTGACASSGMSCWSQGRERRVPVNRVRRLCRLRTTMVLCWTSWLRLRKPLRTVKRPRKARMGIPHPRGDGKQCFGMATSANSADVSNSIRGVRNPKTKDGAGKRYGECCGAQ